MKNKFKSGHRYLVTEPYSRKGVLELYVVEVSPSGERIKFRYLSGAELWGSSDQYEIVEELASYNASWWRRGVEGRWTGA